MLLQNHFTIKCDESIKVCSGLLEMKQYRWFTSSSLRRNTVEISPDWSFFFCLLFCIFSFVVSSNQNLDRKRHDGWYNVAGDHLIKWWMSMFHFETNRKNNFLLLPSVRWLTTLNFVWICFTLAVYFACWWKSVFYCFFCFYINF